MGQINVAMTQLSQLTQQNASASEELAATSEEMSAQAQQLQATMSFFKTNQIAQTMRAPANVSKSAARRAPSVKIETLKTQPAVAAAAASSGNGVDHSDVFEHQFVRF